MKTAAVANERRFRAGAAAPGQGVIADRLAVDLPGSAGRSPPDFGRGIKKRTLERSSAEAVSRDSDPGGVECDDAKAQAAG